MSLDAEDLKAIVTRALGPEAACSMELVATIGGAINDVFRIRIGSQDYALRVRLRENLFAYEHNLIKETLAANFLASEKKGGIWTDNETVLDQCLGAIGQPVKNSRCRLLPQVFFQDGSRDLVPFPWLLQEWASGELVASTTRDHFESIGKALAGLHASGFPRFRISFNDPWREGGDWLDQMCTKGETIAARLGLTIPWQALREEALPQVIGFCLNHNDLQPFNIIASNGEIRFIDWDNLQIGPPEFDLVKLKYWTDCGEDGLFRSNPEKYRRFLAGYQQVAGQGIQDGVFRLCETVWLLRVMSFETARISEGHRPAAPFREPDHYRKCLKTLFEGRNT